MLNQTVNVPCTNGLGTIVAATEFAIVVCIRGDNEEMPHNAAVYATWRLNENGDTCNGNYALTYHEALKDMVKRSL